MNAGQLQKPPVEEWLRWARVIVDRLMGCVHVYKHADDVFMAATERQHKSDAVIKILQRIYALIDQGDALDVHSSEISQKDEQIVAGFDPIVEETLKALTWLSPDMQKLLKSPWMSHFPSKLAEILFAGNGNEFEGIGSGYPEHGRLPAALKELLDREKEGDVRPSRDTAPERHDMERHDRWVQQASASIRTAGRVD